MLIKTFIYKNKLNLKKKQKMHFNKIKLIYTHPIKSKMLKMHFKKFTFISTNKTQFISREIIYSTIISQNILST